MGTPSANSRLATALRRILAARGRSPNSVSTQAGVSMSAISEILTGRITNPRLDTLEAISKVLDVTVAQLIGEGEVALGADVPVLAVPVIGTAQSGAFTDRAALLPGNHARHARTVTVPVNGDLPRGKYFALRVKCRSMERNKDQPIRPGDTVICRDFRDACQPLARGRIYAIRLRLPDGREETSLRRVEPARGRVDLFADTGDPTVAKRVAWPISIKLDKDVAIYYGENNTGMSVLGRVVRVIVEAKVPPAYQGRRPRASGRKRD